MPPSYFPLRWESTGDQWWYASPIDWAAANGHFDLVRELLRLDGNHMIKLTSLRRIRRLETVWDDEEQFHDVAKCRSLVARKIFQECDTKKGKNSLIRSGYGGWLLYTAASAGDLSFVQELLEKDPLLVFGEGEYGVTDIIYAAARSKNSEVFRVVYDFAASPRFMGGGGGGREMEENVGENDIPNAYKLEMKNRAIHAAARGGNLKVFKELIGDDCSDVLGFRDVQGSTVLHAAAARGQAEVVRYLISSFKLIDSTDNEGNTALHVAAHRGHLSVVEALIRASPSSIHLKNKAGETFLHMVMSGFRTPGFRRFDRQVDLMKQLVHSQSFNVAEIVNFKNNEGKTALHVAVDGNVHSDLVELLMTVRSIGVNIRDSSGMTPLDLLKQRPRSAESDVLTRQLISAGGMFTCQDYSARKTIASHLRMRSIGSPGTSFRVSDAEIFLHTGIEHVPDTGGIAGQVGSTPEPAQPDSTSRKPKRVGAKEHLKRILHWPGFKRKDDDKLKKMAERCSVASLDETPVPLRQIFAKPSSSNNNKRTLSNVPSPIAKKKIATGLVQGVMQAMPHLNVRKRSRSSSFSKSPVSSPCGSMDNKQKGVYNDRDIVGSSCPNQTPERGIIPDLAARKQGSSVNQFLCFGGHRLCVKDYPEKDPYDSYKNSVLSVA